MKIKIEEYQTLELCTPNRWHAMPMSKIVVRLNKGDEVDIKIKIKRSKITRCSHCGSEDVYKQNGKRKNMWSCRYCGREFKK